MALVAGTMVPRHQGAFAGCEASLPGPSSGVVAGLMVELTGVKLAGISDSGRVARCVPAGGVSRYNEPVCPQAAKMSAARGATARARPRTGIFLNNIMVKLYDRH